MPGIWNSSECHTKENSEAAVGFNHSGSRIMSLFQGKLKGEKDLWNTL